MKDLVITWRAHQDGAGPVEIGPLLSKTLVVYTSLFFDAMNSNPSDFESWVSGLQHNTFTVFETQNSLEGQLQAGYYSELRERMLKVARQYAKHGQHKRLSNELVLRLKQTTIRFID